MSSFSNPSTQVPVDIPTRPDLQGTIPIDTVATQAQAQTQQSNANGAPSDVAGVLRRNQACLACRRRKLKCDAVRPHCSTCVRSYRHLLRTAPSTNPVLSCEYDDSMDKDHHDGDTSPKEDDDGGKKKKRKASGGRRKADDEVDPERDRLMKRVAELEQQLAQKSTTGANGHLPPSTAPNPWTGAGFGTPPVESPGTFLDMLTGSMPISAQNPGLGEAMFGTSAAPQVTASATSMWMSLGTSADRSESGTGFTPFMSMPSPPAFPDAGPSMLSSSFNFTPAPTGPTTLNWSGDVDMGPPSQEQTWSVNNLANGLSDAAQTSSSTAPKAANVEAADDLVDLDVLNGGSNDSSLDPQILVDLFWPGWPRNLPEPSVTLSLLEVFFEIVPNIPRILNRARFMARLNLPPTHSNFPHPALLHAICSLTASWIEPTPDNITSFFPSVDYDKDKIAFMIQTVTTKVDGMPFSLRQAAFGKDAIQDGLNTGNRLFDVVRAMIILSRVFIDDTRMLECWTYCGLVARMILPLGLNVRSAELSLKSVMLPPPVGAIEREERRIVVWMAMYHDTVASAASGWGSSLSLDELTIPLPVSAVDFNSGRSDVPPNPQDLESLDLYIKHPVVDPLVMALKGAVLLNRVNKFSRKWKNRRLRDNDDLDGMHRPEFRELANAIACLQMSFPPELSNPATLDAKKRLDVDLISAHVIPHAAIICLYEPFADIADPNDQPARRIINAARSVINIIQDMCIQGGPSNLAAVMHSSSSLALVTSARTCLLFYRHALNIGDTAAAEGYKVNIEHARAALASYGLKFKIGYHHAQLIEYFLDRASNPTYEKLVAHYPEHPRPGALPLTKQSHLGQAILNALNIKRGYWKVSAQSHGAGVNVAGTGINVRDMSPSGSTPGSSGSGPGLLHPGSLGSTTEPTSAPTSVNSGAWLNGDSPRGPGSSNPLSPMKYVDFSGNNGAQLGGEVMSSGDQLFNNRFGSQDLSHSFGGQ
ncbi:uncharacterized protein CcaverHIS019_0508030 [Cutaneotrichosporon cavernicola]|uniref:Zn(2)-C6 fungal-type domain-containing protein n=1 Tax=Cutaneotrichosporon cavernicola TaxID=279322 RepID=A0AA48L758_9TREE|nr:uncharacterized protein CcaverHIS019_0508030 [Cutaneotrichosporon cavernicola]BEI93175.1 hypothetical protein CcaverHIS019_0508030 [Cutaneotrichosporon cavernicola]BEJ00953.1 hypothetical protein CcaverHIS631_0508100 [Cutaneotrichosporon cavernicola]BEJ08717.1 hypothetical protein CcaverHIS641_0508110 [Cutaneotrichosporon cavernicola]